MFKRFGNIFLAAALLVTTGTQWAALQSIAWMGMIVSYSEKAPLTVALKETFDGKHPCCLCKAIAAAKKSGKNNPSMLRVKKLEFPPAREGVVLVAPTQFESLPRADDTFAESLTQKPPTPPPRGFSV
ncbi:MAG: hypothetical protein KGJ60_02410 [Verrucomicrobiota bacterium]|nr:hypothetical protein [Verrucomicrobiota bacterium]MDE3066381.1 hypothetical protein [Verrucomicrobiota bacterium]